MLNETQLAFSRCCRCINCDGFPCVLHAKSDAETLAVRPALEFPNVTLMTNAMVHRLETSPTGREVTRVHATHEGKPVEFTGGIVVVSCGAANSAKLLLTSASDQHPRGLANGSDQVGRNYMFHNSQAVLALSKEPNPTIYQKTLGLNDFYFGMSGFEFPMGNIQMVGKSQAPMFRGEKPIETLLAPQWSLERIAKHAVDFWLSTEDLPREENRVTVDAPSALQETLAVLRGQPIPPPTSPTAPRSPASAPPPRRSTIGCCSRPSPTTPTRARATCARSTTRACTPTRPSSTTPPCASPITPSRWRHRTRTCSTPRRAPTRRSATTPARSRRSSSRSSTTTITSPGSSTTPTSARCSTGPRCMRCSAPGARAGRATDGAPGARLMVARIHDLAPRAADAGVAFFVVRLTTGVDRRGLIELIGRLAALVPDVDGVVRELPDGDAVMRLIGLPWAAADAARAVAAQRRALEAEPDLEEAWFFQTTTGLPPAPEDGDDDDADSDDELWSNGPPPEAREVRFPVDGYPAILEELDWYDFGLALKLAGPWTPGEDLVLAGFHALWLAPYGGRYRNAAVTIDRRHHAAHLWVDRFAVPCDPAVQIHHLLWIAAQIDAIVPVVHARFGGASMARKYGGMLGDLREPFVLGGNPLRAVYALGGEPAVQVPAQIPGGHFQGGGLGRVGGCGQQQGGGQDPKQRSHRVASRHE